MAAPRAITVVFRSPEQRRMAADPDPCDLAPPSVSLSQFSPWLWRERYITGKTCVYSATRDPEVLTWYHWSSTLPSCLLAVLLVWAMRTMTWQEQYCSCFQWLQQSPVKYMDEHSSLIYYKNSTWCSYVFPSMEKKNICFCSGMFFYFFFCQEPIRPYNCRILAVCKYGQFCTGTQYYSSSLMVYPVVLSASKL